MASPPSEPPKPYYAAVPARAMGDERLSALDLRVMMAIAGHDRFTKNGIGCTAGHGRLAALVGCHLKSLSRSIRHLAECGYVIGQAHPLNPKSRAYLIVYRKFDREYFQRTKAITGNETVTPTGNETVPESGSMGNRLPEIVQQNQKDGTYKILGETLIDPVETVLRDPVETAPKPEKRRNVGTQLAMLERAYKARHLTKNDMKEATDWLEQQLEHLDCATQEYGRCFRLLEDLGGMLQ